jgi:hypothetical protein
MKRLLAPLVLAVSASACTAQLRPVPVRLDAANPDSPEGAPLRASTTLAAEPAPGKREVPPKPDSTEGSGQPAAGRGDTSEDAVYTCPMHPEVERSEPGRCPKCGMDLVPKEQGTTGGEAGAGDAEGHGEHEGHGGGGRP